jgi:hypothetical protein
LASSCCSGMLRLLVPVHSNSLIQTRYSLLFFVHMRLRVLDMVLENIMRTFLKKTIQRRCK